MPTRESALAGLDKPGKVFINAGWPYGYAEPGLHNFLPIFLADVLARYYRSQGADTFFLGGMDEHGEKVATYARVQGQAPQDLVDTVYQKTRHILDQLDVSYSTWGRTSWSAHRRYASDYIDRLRQRSEQVATRMVTSAYCESCDIHVPDRFIASVCQACDSATYGGKCTNLKCGLVDDIAIEGSQCGVCGSALASSTVEQLALSGLGSHHIERPDGVTVLAPQGIGAAQSSEFSSAIGLSRPGAWGVDIAGMPGHVVYSWVDSLLAKLSHAPVSPSPISDDTLKIFVVGPDSIPFYASLFPELVAQAGYPVANWVVSSTPLALFQGNVCSKTTSNGIWLEEALAVLPGSVWRLYLSYLLAKSASQTTVELDWNELVDLLLAISERGLQGIDVADHDGFEPAEFDRLITGGEYGSAFQYAVSGVRAGDERAARAIELFVPGIDELVAFLRRPEARRVITEARYRYDELTEKRSSARSIRQEIFDARATFMCACSGNFVEQ